MIFDELGKHVQVSLLCYQTGRQPDRLGEHKRRSPDRRCAGRKNAPSAVIPCWMTMTNNSFDHDTNTSRRPHNSSPEYWLTYQSRQRIRKPKMTSNSSGRGVAFGSRASVPTFGNLGNALLERRNPGIGRSTPDSEVLASSDEEMDQAKRSTESRKAPANRRTSLLAEPSIEHRRSSFAGSNASQPNTPGTGQDTWAAISPSIGHYNGSSFPFGQSIWSGTREPPLRFSETRQDTEKSPPSSTGQPGQTIYRSLSFSVGQKDNETTSQRPSQTLQRRTSRQNTLAPENGGLERVNEDENMHHDAAYNTSPSLGRQGGRALSTTTMSHTTSNLRGRMRSLGNGQPDLTLDDTEESASQLRYPVHAAPTRRLSDLQSLAPSRQPIGPPYSNSIFRNSRIGPQWSTGDYDPLEAIPQSRRHSFADVSTRRGSLGSEGMCWNREPKH